MGERLGGKQRETGLASSRGAVLPVDGKIDGMLGILGNINVS